MGTDCQPFVIETCRKAEAESGLGLLSGTEAAHYALLKTPKRRLDWLCGRIAAKRALARFFEQTGAAVALNEFEIFNDDTGRPFCRAPRPAPDFSISHTDLGGLCAVAPSGRIGADWEMIEVRDPALFETVFTAEERTAALMSSPLEQTRLWALKEAVLKFLGTGLSCDPKSIRFEGAQVRLAGDALKAWTGLGRPSLRTESYPEEGAVIAVAYS